MPGCCIGLALLCGIPAVAAEQRPLEIRVTPGGYDQSQTGSTRRGETLEEKVARRDREMSTQFRNICRGCLSPEAEASLESLRDPSPRRERQGTR